SFQKHLTGQSTRRLLLLGFDLAALGLFALAVVRILPQHVWRTPAPAVRFATSGCPGDVNGDGQRNIRDIVLIQSHILGKQLLTGAALDAADVNGDGSVDVLDVVRLLQHITRRTLLDDCRVIQNNPVPTLTNISPTSARAGDPALTVTLIGTNFVNTSVVLWDGVAKPTTFVSATQLTASIAASDLAADNTVAVAVSNPTPGGGISGAKTFYIAPKTAPPLSTANIRFISPKKAKVGTQFTILGSSFDATPSKNTVVFSDTGDTPAQVISGTTNSIVATVPAGLVAGKKYSVTVTANGQTSNPVGFEITTTAAPLEIKPPGDKFLLMPPGSGKKNLVIGGGTPPYKLKPLSTDDQAKARAELKGNIIELTGIDAGKFGATSVFIEVSDSATPPATSSVSVRVQNPIFDPKFDILPHNLLAGSAPGVSFKVSTSFGEMSLAKTKIIVDSVSGDFTNLKQGYRIGYVDADGTYGFVQVGNVRSPSQLDTQLFMKGPLTFDDAVKGRQTLAIAATGGLIGAANSVTFTQVVEPLPESVIISGTDSETTLFDGIVRLPSTADTVFTVTATFTSASVFEGKYLPMTKVVTKTFKTVAPPAGAPQITRVSPDRGEVGRVVTIEGSGFSSTPGNNKVTFAAPFGSPRVEAEVTSAAPSKLVVSVPRGAIYVNSLSDTAGVPLQVTVNDQTSNPHWFRMLFAPDGWMMLSDLKGGAAVGPLIYLSQGSDSVKIATAQIRLDSGTMSTSGLTKDKAAGTALWTQFGNNETLDLVYRGQEATGAKRHIFDIQEQGSFPSKRAQLFMSPGTNNAGVVFDFAFVQNYDLSGKGVLIRFDTPVCVLPAAGANIPTVVEFTSRQWMYLPTSPMKVRFPLTLTTNP
ncbi:MAG TPA: IPT/TIG domain-containing protein, partial [Acidobacteriota bacterium]|nr:IPT/TIG domain-containing protein [Acidobacteriota bacterium]